MEAALLTQILTIGGPITLIAVLAIIINWKLMIKWSDEREKTAAAGAVEREATMLAWAKERVEVSNHLITIMTSLEVAITRLEAKM